MTDWWTTDADEEREEGVKTAKNPDDRKISQKEKSGEKIENEENINMVSLIINKMEDIKKEITNGKMKLNEVVNGLSQRIRDIEDR